MAVDYVLMYVRSEQLRKWRIDNMNIMIVGVGGQGTLLASRILGRVAIKEGYDVKVSEVHGMSQRGGEKVYSPIIDRGEADLILAFEMLEAYRALPYLKEGGKILANSQRMNPMPVITGAMKYPDNIEDKLSEKVNIKIIDALSLARQAGTIKAVNVVLIGFLAKSMDVDKNVWTEVIKETVPPKFLEMNLKAFELGYNM